MNRILEIDVEICAPSFSRRNNQTPSDGGDSLVQRLTLSQKLAPPAATSLELAARHLMY